ncbi:TPA: fimbrial chaperone [Citrobacter braakii]|uniref:fimbrial chaperone n=1 Tax=unclassified Citrobacter TaxID=2644389 RepID=UPI0008FF80AB|nr:MULTISPECIES: fimbrial chaperone [unclassified Citrobacter]MCQ7058406.1 fimbrial chaperone [Escherichia coli]MDM2942167.1 fimbrial chaperone [Citrobacter sp. Cm038]
MPIKNIFTVIIFTTFISFSAPSTASIVINATRVIYPSDAKEALIKMVNQGQQPLLIQSWLDDGHEDVDPQALNVPFIASPPVSRVDPKQGLTVRLNWDGQPLPTDRESVYWFNALEIPKKNKDADKSNQLQIALKTRIKVFYRPISLPGSPAEAIQHLQWSLANQEKQVWATAKNDSPYFVSLVGATITSGGKKYNIEPDMVAPFSSARYAVKSLTSTQMDTISWTAVNDYGGNVEATKK